MVGRCSGGRRGGQVVNDDQIHDSMEYGLYFREYVNIKHCKKGSDMIS